MNDCAGGPRAAAPAASGERLRLDWVQPIGLLSLSIANLLLKIVTLGIYHFWGKTEVRRRLWSAIRMQDEPLEYTGVGRELLIGFLIVFVLVLLPLTLASFALVIMFGPNSAIPTVFQILIYLLGAFLVGVGTYRAQRYRLSRTRWRGIRMGLVGNSWGYGWTYFWTLLLLPLTLGWATPWRATRLQRIVTDDMRFGDRPFRFTGSAGPLYGPFAILWVGTIAIVLVTGQAFTVLLQHPDIAGLVIKPGQLDLVTLMKLLLMGYAVAAVALFAYSIFSAFYRAAQINHFAAHTFFEGATFRASASGGGLVWLAVGNFLIWLLGALTVVLVVAGAAIAGFQALGDNALLTRQVFIWLTALVLVASMGLFGPIIQGRTMRYLVERLEIDGELALAGISQAQGQRIRRGEGLAEAFDIDAF